MKNHFSIPYSLRAMILSLYFIMCSSQVFSARIQWKPVPEEDLKGYLIYCGTQSGIYSDTVDVGNIVEYEMTALDTGITYFFTIKAYDTWGNLSHPSPELDFLIERQLNHSTNMPEISEAFLNSTTELELDFNGSLDRSLAENVSSYSIHPSIAISGVRLNSDRTRVFLTTQPHQVNNYTILVNTKNCYSRFAYECTISDISEFEHKGPV